MPLIEARPAAQRKPRAEIWCLGFLLLSAGDGAFFPWPLRLALALLRDGRRYARWRGQALESRLALQHCSILKRSIGSSPSNSDTPIPA